MIHLPQVSAIFAVFIWIMFDFVFSSSFTPSLSLSMDISYVYSKISKFLCFRR